MPRFCSAMYVILISVGIFSTLPTAAQTRTTAAQTASTQYIDISLDALFSAGWADAKEETIGVLEGGAHDPKKRGFTVQNIELSLNGAVDPYFTGEAHLIYQITPEGESILEVEEVFLTTLALPAGLQVKAGHFFIEFGRLNPRHPHTWNFVDQPVVNTRMLGGDGLRTPGFRLSWLSPLPWYADFKVGIHNANGETASSFLSALEGEEGEGPEFAGHPLIERPVDSIDDLLYTFRWLNSLDFAETITANLGASALWGPNATGDDTRTEIVGSDLYLKWKPLQNYRGWPFVAVQSEVMFRRYEAGAFVGAERNQGSEVFRDWGTYTEVMWGFKPRWVAAMRTEWADGNGENQDDPLRDRRLRLSPAMSWYPSEFSKLRFQFNYDRAEHLDDQTKLAFWMQYEFMFGAHPGHKF